MNAKPPDGSTPAFVAGPVGGPDHSWPPAYGRGRSPDGTRASGLHVVIGGIASGKSAVAEEVASRLSHGRPVIYLATSPAPSSDAEMGARIAAHRVRRPSSWVTIEAPRELATAVAEAMVSGFSDVILLEDVGVLAASHLPWIETGPDGREEIPEGAREATVAAVLGEVDAVRGLVGPAGGSLVVVCQDPGGGLVPTSALARLWIDVIGRVNQSLVREADTAWAVIAGLPVDLHAGAKLVEAFGMKRGQHNDAS